MNVWSKSNRFKEHSTWCVTHRVKIIQNQPGRNDRNKCVNGHIRLTINTSHGSQLEQSVSPNLQMCRIRSESSHDVFTWSVFFLSGQAFYSDFFCVRANKASDSWRLSLVALVDHRPVLLCGATEKQTAVSTESCWQTKKHEQSIFCMGSVWKAKGLVCAPARTEPVPARWESQTVWVFSIQRAHADTQTCSVLLLGLKSVTTSPCVTGSACAVYLFNGCLLIWKCIV